MAIFFELVLKVIPLYFMILAGFVAGRVFNVAKEPVANLLIYVLLPVIMFYGIVQAEINAVFVIVPVVFFCFSALLCILFTKIGRFQWKDGTERLLGFVVGSSNTGYFGIPVALALFGSAVLPMAVLIDFGVGLAVATFGFYTLARSELSSKEAVRHLTKFPPLYGFLLGLIVNLLNVPLPNFLIETLELTKNGYAPLGMILIGLGLAVVRIEHIHPHFLVTALVSKFTLWIIFFSVCIFLDANYFHLLNDTLRAVVLIQAATPIAANTVAYASRFNVHPEKAAIVVITSTLISLVVIPLAVLTLQT